MQKVKNPLPIRYRIPDMSAYAESKMQERNDATAVQSSAKQKAQVNKQTKQLNTEDKVAQRRTQKRQQLAKIKQRVAEQAPQRMEVVSATLPGMGAVGKIALGTASAIASYPYIKNITDAAVPYVTDAVNNIKSRIADLELAPAFPSSNSTAPVTRTQTQTQTQPASSGDNNDDESWFSRQRKRAGKWVGDKIAGIKTTKSTETVQNNDWDFGLPRWVKKHPYITLGVGGLGGFGGYEGYQYLHPDTAKKDSTQTADPVLMSLKEVPDSMISHAANNQNLNSGDSIVVKP